MAHSIPLSPPIGLVRLPSLARPAHLNAHCTTHHRRQHADPPIISHLPPLLLPSPNHSAAVAARLEGGIYNPCFPFPFPPFPLLSLSLLLNWPDILPQILPGPLKATGFDTTSSPLSSPPPRPLPLYKPLPQPPLPFPPLTIHTRPETSSRRCSLSLSPPPLSPSSDRASPWSGPPFVSAPPTLAL